MADPIFTTPVTNPFGLPAPGTIARLAFADIDGDGDRDLFIGLGGGSTSFLRNTGTALAPVFALEGDNFGLSNVGFNASPALVDIDGDGDLDAFVGNTVGVLQFFRNTGSATAPTFSAEPGNFNLPDIGASVTPTFVDIDSDGDADAFIGKSDGVLRFVRNTGTANAPAFTLEVGTFGLPDVAGSATPVFADVDGDGDQDAFVGNFDGITQFFRNTGTASAPQFASASGNFGITDVSSHANPALTDIDADGDLDAFVSSGDGALRFFLNTAAGIRLAQSAGATAVAEGGLTDSFTVVLNAAPTGKVTVTLDATNQQVALSASTLTFTSANWNIAQTVQVKAVNDSVGEGAHRGAVQFTVASADTSYNGMTIPPMQVRIQDDDLPTGAPVFASPVANPLGLTGLGILANIALADLDGDGDIDALVSEGYGNNRLYRNTGTVNAPAFTPENSNLGLTNLEFYPDPALGDVDGDGDLDAFIGLGSGTVAFFRNTGNASVPAFTRELGGLNLSISSNIVAPALADIDSDGDLDMFVGGFDGETRFFLNTGGPTNPVFEARVDNFGLTNVGGGADPTFCDVDADGDLDALIGETYGALRLFRNTGNATAPAFVADFSAIGLNASGGYASPAVGDLDGDGDLDVLLGNDGDNSLRLFLNNLPGVQVAQSGDITAVTEGGTGDLYTVVLKSAPAANVVITLGGATAQIGTGASALVFTPTNWNVAQNVFVTATDDALGEGTHSSAILHTVSSTDMAYQGLVVQPVPVLIIDNDLPQGAPQFASPVAGAFGLPTVGVSATPVFADIDADGDLDAFVGIADGTVSFLRNTGSATAPAFNAEAGNFGLTNPSAYAAPALVDIDGDGDLDAFVGFMDGVTRFFRNSGTASAANFTREAGALDLTTNGGYAQPTFADLDGDGDLDAIVGNTAQPNLLLFRNVGSATAPAFVVEPGLPGITSMELYPSPRTVDIDGDGDMDLVLGQDFIDDPVVYRNTGTTGAPYFTAEAGNFGLAGIGQYARPTFVDIDGDGDQDAIAGNLSGQLMFLENAAPGMQFRQSNGNTSVTEGGAGDSYTVQLRTAPAANVTLTLSTTNHQAGTSTDTLIFTPANWNQPQTVTVTALDDKIGEGGHSGVLTHTVSSTDVSYNAMVLAPLYVTVVDNDRPQADPQFVLSEVNPFGLASAGTAAAPSFADIDADGDLDVFVGYDSGEIRFFRNTGSPGTASFVVQGGNLGLVDVDSNASVAFADADADGDLDAFVGSALGTIRTFRNVGTASSAGFVEELGDVGLSDIGSFSKVAAADIDGDRDIDVFASNSVGDIFFFRNVGNPDTPQFSLQADNLGFGQVGPSASLAFADIDGDGDPDAAVGDLDGNTTFFRNLGTAQAPGFVDAAGNTFGIGNVGNLATPTFADVDADGDLDALVGNLVGGTRLYLNNSELGLTAPTEISFIDSPQDDPFATFALKLNALGADGAPVTYGIVGGTSSGGVVSSTSAYGVLAVQAATGVASFTPNQAAMEALAAAASVSFTVNVTDGVATTSQLITVQILQSGTTETTGDDSLAGTSGNERIDALAGQDNVQGQAGNDTLAGFTGDDTLDGGSGNDSLVGGDGNDTYIVDSTLDAVSETNAVLAVGGNDRVYSSVTWVLGDHLESLYLTGTASLTGVGNALANRIEGNSGTNNYLSGGAGADTMVGGDGNDTYYLDDATDVVIETNAQPTGGTDTVVATVTYSAGNHIENIVFAGSAGTTGIGNALANYLEGNAAQNYLFGGAGTDTMKGNDGNDIYYVDDSTDVVLETNALAAGGTDTVVSTVTYELGANLEQLLLSGSAAITGIGNAGANYIEGNSAQNYISGGAGTDTMKGNDGNDVYYVDVSTDVVIETNADTVSGGVDFVVSTVTYQLGANVENLLLDGNAPITGIGSAVNNYIEGNNAANFISGGAGADTMKGNDGNDVYYVDNIGDVVIETNAVQNTGGRDTVSSSIAYALGANVEDLLLSGNSVIGGLGNGLANYMTGNTAANALSGQDGNDTLIGGTGTDTLTGGLGADTFDFNSLLDSLAGTSRDVITDFSSAQGDKVDLAGIDANSVVASDQAFSFIGAAAFSTVAGQLRYAGNILAGDTDGNGAADFEIQLTGVATMVVGDLVL